MRIRETLEGFDRVYVSFSAGKDSTVMLHLVCDEARAMGKTVGVLLIDLEGQYKITIQHAESMREQYADCTEWFWVCLPIHLRNAVSMYQPFWKCWDSDAKESWIRQPPDHAITDVDVFEFFEDGMEFEEFVPLFGEWYSQGKSCACFVGIRSDESLNRFRTVSSSVKVRWNNRSWTTKVTDNSYNVYPIYDWSTGDVWTYHALNPGKRHNELYELMYKAGLTPSQMRICQPYGDDQRRGLWLFHLIEPETWGKVVARVNGANSGALYVQENGNMTGYNKITLPPGHTWRTFAELLLKTLPDATAEHFRAKIDVFRKWHMDRGYPNGIPDAAEPELEAARVAPSWRRVCKAILRNDYWCKGLGFSQHKSGSYERYMSMMKKRREKTEWKIDAVELKRSGRLFE